jgi:hypothetical protein
MAALMPADAVLSVGQRIGRYFAVVSMIPALFLVLWTYALVASGAVSGTPSLHKVDVTFSQWSLGKVAGVVLVTLAVAVILHPLQFVSTQLLEGYWGTTRLALATMKVRIVHHRERQRNLRTQARNNKEAWVSACRDALNLPRIAGQEEDPEQMMIVKGRMASRQGDRLMLHFITQQGAHNKLVQSYPADPTRILPTQLGNALRSFEDAAGKQYGLDALTISPHLHLVAPAAHLEYLVDARQDMDSAVRICTVGLIATALTAALMLTHGLWLLWALLPYSASYLAYKGAVSAAQGYGVVIASIIDLDRFLLYDKLGMYPPQDTREERANNQVLMALLSREPNTEHVIMRYHQ